MQTDRKTEEQIFKAVIQLTTAGEREAYILEACGDNQELLTGVRTLLKYHDTDSFLDAPIFEPNMTLEDSPIAEGPGAVIGRYKLLEKIGEGGMAVVYMAEQQEPIRRKLALKIIKLGMDTKSVIARFEAERQALAMMDHPNIAKVLDAGATETGRPYFVMELVTGVSITEYCDKNNLSTKERLALFIRVCNAVQHAHQKGIIHRDIKPTNVMVTQLEGTPVPKVIDFGIAKATNQKLTEKTLFTRYAHIIGTPAYMSPEQAELSDLDVDTRTDIYSLGVLLYELLTGTTPFSEQELREAGFLQMQKIICEAEPAKPSTKLSTLGKALTDIAKLHSSSPEAMPKLIRGDLDWIVMKSLEKERTRRYDTASALSLDIRRHLDNEPVLARAPKAMYRFEKFLRRHQHQTIAALAITVLIVAVISIFSMWNRDRQQLDEAERFRHRGILSQAREQYAKADREAAIETMRPVLSSKYVGPDAQLLYALVLIDNRRSDEAVTILNNLLNDSPEIAGAAHSLLARILWESESPDAEKLKQIDYHRQQAEALLPETAEAYFLRAMTSVTIKEQLASLAKALQLESGHYESRRLRAYTYYASRKYDLLRDDALAMTILRQRDPLGYSLRAIALRELGKYKDAIAEYDKAIALTPDKDPQYIELSVQRCETLLYMGDYEQVISDARACQKVSPDNPIFQYYTFCALTGLGDYDKADTAFRQIVRRIPTSRNEFRQWCAKHLFDTLEAGRSWHPQDRKPAGAAFLPMVEAEEAYRSLSAKGRRLATNGFSANWSPDGSKLAFSAGVHGYSGVAVFDTATKETELLIVPGKDPKWSPDGQYIAFVRDCQFLRPEELAAAERNPKQRRVADEEVWVMKFDGTESRLLARGSWPTWGKDSVHVYFQSRRDEDFCSISIVGPDVEPKRIMACSSIFPSVSPDSQRVAYLEGASLKVEDLASQAVVAEWHVPFSAWGGPAWSPTGQELCLGAGSNVGDRTGLWIYSLDANEPVKVLDSQIIAASWAPDGTKLVFGLHPPYFELWVADLDPVISAVEALGPGQTLNEHWGQMLGLYARRIQADPHDASAYSDRARYYDYLHEREKADADMRLWSAVVSGQSPSDFQDPMARPRRFALPAPASPDASRGSGPDEAARIRRVINMPFNYQVVFSAERPVREILLLNVAFGQKGKCTMKSFQMPILSMSLLEICLLSGLDTPSARADFTFERPASLPRVIPALPYDSINSCSLDGLEMYVFSNPGRPGGRGGYDLWVLKRDSVDADWGPPENLGPAVNSPQLDAGPSISADGLTLYFYSNRSGGYGDEDLYMTTRATRNAPWGQAVNMGPKVNTPQKDTHPRISPDDLELYFVSERPGGYGGFDIYSCRRATAGDPWGDPMNLGPVVNSAYHEAGPALSPDGLLLIFFDFPGALRPGGYGGADLWMARRANVSSPWQTPANMGPIVNSERHDGYPLISPDGSMLYLWSTRSGGDDNYQVSIIPTVDFTGDGIVDGKDVLCMASRWSTDDPLCDIGPYAWGDGTVGIEDLILLSDYLGKEVVDSTLVAHWALDETEGMVVTDSAGDNNGYALGDPLWQPDGGQVNGTLEFDGVDDCVVTSFAFDPAEGPFSVLAWVKGGAPGQVVLSGTQGTNYLMADTESRLMSELGGTGQSGGPLVSETIITDGQWHRIGLVWDGSRRILYADGSIVAEDMQHSLESSGSGQYIGTGKAMEPGTFFWGLIDDVRIYSRVVRP